MNDNDLTNDEKIDDSAWDVEDEDVLGAGPLFEGDVGQLAEDVRRTFVSILKRRYISSDRHAADWRVAVENEQLLQSRFNDMFLTLVVDHEYEVAYKKQASSEGGPFPTVLHDTAYSREQTVLLIHLRGIFRSKRASGEEVVFVDREELMEEVANYRPGDSTNQVRDERGARNAIDALCTGEILLKTSDADRFRVSPIIEVLLPVNRVQELLQWLMARGDDTPDDLLELDEGLEVGAA